MVLPLSGHAPSHIGFIAPDDVAYLGDAILLPATRIPVELSCSIAILLPSATLRKLHVPITLPPMPVSLTTYALGWNKNLIFAVQRKQSVPVLPKETAVFEARRWPSNHSEQEIRCCTITALRCCFLMQKESAARYSAAGSLFYV